MDFFFFLDRIEEKKKVNFIVELYVMYRRCLYGCLIFFCYFFFIFYISLIIWDRGIVYDVILILIYLGLWFINLLVFFMNYE